MFIRVMLRESRQSFCMFLDKFLLVLEIEEIGETLIGVNHGCFDVWSNEFKLGLAGVSNMCLSV